MSRPAPQLHILPDPDALYRAAAERLLELGNQTLAQHDAFHLALAGGATPQGLYALLARQPERLDWSRVHLYFGDERGVPPEHRDSNYRMVREALLDHLPAAPQVHRISGELAPEQAAADYAALLRHHLPAEGFDLLLLGLGPDGHIASLFPGGDALNQRKQAVAADYVPKLDSWRITLTLPALNRARHVMLLVSGAHKADVLRHVLRNIAHANPLPVEMLRPKGQLEWFVDAQAARHITPRS
ncbi:MAG: 6-phosphogluconolactonase [Pseudomonadota bacterium]